MKGFRSYIKRASRVKLILLGATVLLVTYILGYYIVVRPIQVNNQKKEFDKAEQEITALANRIKEKTKRVHTVNKDSTCHYASQKYTTGPLSCGISIKLTFLEVTASEANEIMKQSSQEGDGAVRANYGLRDPVTKLPAENFWDTPELFDQEFYQNLSSYGGLTCGTSYIYRSSSTQAQKTGANESTIKNLDVSMDCSGPALAEFYLTSGK